MTLRVVADTSGADVAAPTIPPARDTLRPTADYRQRGVRGWQEAESTAARDKLRRQRPCNRHYFPTPGPARAIPISWKYSQFSKQASGYRLTHKGEAGVTPNRYVTWALRRHRDTQAEFLFLNTHFISGAFSGSHPERQGRWIRHRDEVRDLIAALKDRYPRRPVSSSATSTGAAPCTCRVSPTCRGATLTVSGSTTSTRVPTRRAHAAGYRTTTARTIARSSPG